MKNMHILAWHIVHYMHITWQVAKINAMSVHSPMLFRMMNWGISIRWCDGNKYFIILLFWKFLTRKRVGLNVSKMRNKSNPQCKPMYLSVNPIHGEIDMEINGFHCKGSQLKYICDAYIFVNPTLPTNPKNEYCIEFYAKFTL